MNRRSFIKVTGIAGSTLAAREIAGALITKNMESNKSVVAINGSPNEGGNTVYALSLVGKELEKEGIAFEVIHIGNKRIRGCMACNHCFEKGQCIYTNEQEKEWVDKMKKADAIVLASPVYFGGIAGTMKSFLDRIFFAYSQAFRNKIGVSLVTARRSGASATFTSLNQYLTISQMIVPSSVYWNNIHATVKEEIAGDEEGVRIMQTLGKNVATLLGKGIL
ncbi:2-amino-4-deoxychorismate dehydrogenase [termite gut metagenome]|uniref:2-amino-4-deoxychorismate dehydrogenase n=1 Tax=termite gut metagenome TaxID=433724 RepID=A0A5J4T0U0_9ZZZZ